MAGDQQQARWNTALLSIYCYGRQGAQGLAQQVAAKRLVSLDDAVSALIAPLANAALGQVRLALADLCRTSVETSDASLAAYVSKLAAAFAQLTGAPVKDVSEAFAKIIQLTPPAAPQLAAAAPAASAAASAAMKARVSTPTPTPTPAEMAYQSALTIMVAHQPPPPGPIRKRPVEVVGYWVTDK